MDVVEEKLIASEFKCNRSVLAGSGANKTRGTLS